MPELKAEQKPKKRRLTTLIAEKQQKKSVPLESCHSFLFFTVTSLSPVAARPEILKHQNGKIHK